MTANPWLLMSLPAAVAVAGGALAAVWKPSHGARSLIQHFAAGVILAALAVELLPEIGREHGRAPIVLGAFAAGCLFMFGMKLLTRRWEAQGAAEPAGQAAQSLSIGLLVATFIDVAMDGFIIGAGFAAGGETGRVLALGLSVELLFLGLAVTSDAIAGWRVVLTTAALGGVVVGFAHLGHWLLAGASHDLLAGTLAFSAAALLYLVTEELLMEAHEVAESTFSTLVLFAGFLIFWAIQLLA